MRTYNDDSILAVRPTRQGLYPIGSRRRPMSEWGRLAIPKAKSATLTAVQQRYTIEICQIEP